MANIAGRRAALRGLGALSATALAPAARAQDYPSRPIRLIVPFAAGSATDTVGRVFGQKMAEVLGQPIVVENRPGANGTIAAEAVARAPADGYTLLVGTNTTNAAIRTLMKSVPYDPDRDFAPISFLGILPQVVCVSAASPIRTVPELIAFARANPEKVTYAWANSTQRVSTEMLASMAGLKLHNVPYKSSPQAMADLLSGQINLYVPDMIVALPQVRGGKVRALGVTSATRSPLLPEVPTVAEAGNLPGYELLGIFAAFAPAGTPREAIQRLNDAIRRASTDAELRNRFSTMGLEVQPSTPEQLGERFRAETARWTKYAGEAGIRPE